MDSPEHSNSPLPRSAGCYRPWRSLTFWSGVLGLVFVGWAWGDSLKYQSSVRWGYWGFYHDHFGVAVACTHVPTHWEPGPQFSRVAFPATRKIPVQVRGVVLQQNSLITRFHLSAGHWALMCLGVIGWTLGLYARVRRRQRQGAHVEKMAGR